VCGRYSLAGPDPAQVRALYPVAETVAITRRYNVAPGDDVLAVTTARDGAARAELLRWGLVPAWSRDTSASAKMINARAETIAERPAYRGAFARMRCLIVADGFYEWRRHGGAVKQAFHITAHGRQVFAFAGLWSVWHAPDGGALRTCTIVTTAANATVAPLHDRMPLILPREAEALWLDSGTPAAELQELMRGGLPPADTLLRPVGPAVNDARYDGPECLAGAPASQATLF
jgi:putative SOS response-associated peptidase YedK